MIQYNADRVPHSYDPESLIFALKERQPFLNYKVMYTDTIRRPKLTFTVTVSVLPDTETVALYQDALTTCNIDRLPDNNYCRAQSCFLLAEDSKIYCDRHHDHSEQSLDVYRYKESVLTKIKQQLEIMTPPDRFCYQDTELFAYHQQIRCWKAMGESPRILMERVMEQHSIPTWVKCTVVPRLNPISMGFCTLFIGSTMLPPSISYTCYQYQLILGISTDTGDALGIITDISQVTHMCAKDIAKRLPRCVSVTESSIQSYVKDCIGDIYDVQNHCGKLAYDTFTRIKQWREVAKNRPELTLWKIIIRGAIGFEGLPQDGPHIGIPYHYFRVTSLMH